MATNKNATQEPTDEQVELLRNAGVMLANGLTLLIAADAPDLLTQLGQGPGGRASMTRKQALAYTGLKGTTFDRYKREGRIKVGWKNGRNPMFYRDDLDRLTEQLRS